jgi:hypothetical protein
MKVLFTHDTIDEGLNETDMKRRFYSGFEIIGAVSSKSWYANWHLL